MGVDETGTVIDWSARFPGLFTPLHVGYANADVTFTVDAPPDELVARIHCVAVTPDGGVIVCRSIDEWRFLPGGTREPGETISRSVARELLEEAGARVSGDVTVFASQVARSRNPGPYRPHLPHPLAYWAFAITTAEIVQSPTNPPDGEQVIEVLTLPPSEAAAWLAVHDSGHADVVRLADAMGLIPG
jgi:8-oxo-dGTP diphosphatase